MQHLERSNRELKEDALVGPGFGVEVGRIRKSSQFEKGRGNGPARLCTVANSKHNYAAAATTVTATVTLPSTATARYREDCYCYDDDDDLYFSYGTAAATAAAATTAHERPNHHSCQGQTFHFSCSLLGRALVVDCNGVICRSDSNSFR